RACRPGTVGAAAVLTMPPRGRPGRESPPMARAADAHRDLVFGLLALQTGLIDQGQLVAAFHAWTRAQGRPMAAILAERGALAAARGAVVGAGVGQHLKRYGDAGRSLAALAAGGPPRDRLARLGDPALDASLAHVGTAPVLPPDADGAAERTATYTVGTAT